MVAPKSVFGWFVPFVLALSPVACARSAPASSDSSPPPADESIGASPTTSEDSSPVETTTNTTIAATPLNADEFFASNDAIDPDDILPAFAALVGPLPDVTPMTIQPSPGSSLTPLVNAVLAGFETYTPEQQEAITALVRPESNEPGGFRRPRPATVVGELQDFVDSLVPVLNELLGWTYPRRSPLVHYVDRAYVESDGTWAEATATDWFTPSPLNTLDCDIWIGTTAATAVISVQREKLLHEVFHCFQYAYFGGTIGDFNALGGWRTEGTAAWVGLEAAGGGPTDGVSDWWRVYLQGHVDGAYALSEGYGYHAVGFWSFLQARRSNVWALALPQLLASSQAAAFQQVTGDDPGLLAQWASSTTRQGWSAAWDTSGPGITSDRRAGAPLAVDTGSTYGIAIQNLQNRVDRVEFGPDVEYAAVRVHGVGTLSFEGNGERSMINRLARFCFLDDCLCPDGSPPFDGAPYDTVGRSTMWLGTGSLSTGATNSEILGLTKQDVCRPCESASGSAGTGGGTGFRRTGSDDECPDPCLNGKWLYDNAVAREEFIRIATSTFSSVDVSGDTIWEFEGGHLIVTYGHSVVVTAPLEGGLTLVNTNAFVGQVETDYSAVAGLFDARNQTSTASINTTSEISGQAVTTSNPVEAGNAIGVEGTYECLGNDLAIHTALPVAVTAVLHRITPTD